MVSRRKILSRSRDDLNLEAPPQEEEEDIWYNKDKLYKVRSIEIETRTCLCDSPLLVVTGQQIPKA